MGVRPGEHSSRVEGSSWVCVEGGVSGQERGSGPVRGRIELIRDQARSGAGGGGGHPERGQ